MRDGAPASKYRTAPDKNLTGMPPGVPYIIGNEAAERFSFYGMRSILIIFMTTYLMNASGKLSVMNENEATGWFHAFVFWSFFLSPLSYSSTEHAIRPGFCLRLARIAHAYRDGGILVGQKEIRTHSAEWRWFRP